MSAQTSSAGTSATGPAETTWSIAGLGLKATSAADLEPHLGRLAAMPTVHAVHLGGNSLGIGACEAIARVLKGKTELQVADLADIFTGRLIDEIPRALAALCDALAEHTSLHTIDLSDNAFGGRCADAMTPFLERNRSLRVFRLNNNGLGVWGGSVVAKALLARAEAVKAEGGTSNLEEVVCGRNRLENGSAPFFADAFAAHGTLKVVRLPQNGIRPEGIVALAQGLKSCAHLEHLDLQDNTATATGSRALASALPAWPALRVLNLSDCLLSPAGGVALCNALAGGSSPALEALLLQYGEMDARAIHSLARAVEAHMPKLAQVELNGNRADAEDECVERLRDALKGHGHEDALDELDDMEEPPSDEGEDDDEDEQEPESEDEAQRRLKAGGGESKPAQAVATESEGVTLVPGQNGSIVLDKQADALADRLGGVSLDQA